jgi:hypothetical protein
MNSRIWLLFKLFFRMKKVFQQNEKYHSYLRFLFQTSDSIICKYDNLYLFIVADTVTDRNDETIYFFSKIRVKKPVYLFQKNIQDFSYHLIRDILFFRCDPRSMSFHFEPNKISTISGIEKLLESPNYLP